LAWFAGFLPHDNPRYAFAVLYEGRPGETVSGGRMAAPMVKAFFEGVKEDIQKTIEPAPVAVEADEQMLQAVPVDEPIQAVPVAEPIQALPVDDALDAILVDEYGQPYSGEQKKSAPLQALPVEE
jgi:penicillin-binding protein 2